MPPSDALYQQAQLRQELESGAYRLYMEAMVPSMQRPEVGQPLIPLEWTPEKVRADMALWTQAARTYYVSPDMMRLAVGAMSQLPDDATVERQSPMSPQGFLWLAESLKVIDLRGRVLAVNAILWSVFGGGCMVWLLADKYDPLNAAWAVGKGWVTAQAEIPRLTPWHGMILRFGDPLPLSIQLSGQRPIPPDVDVQVYQDGDSVTWHIADEGYSAEEMRPERRPAQEALFLTVVWRLMRQTIVDVRPEEPDKRSRRLAEKYLRNDRHVTVIELRRREYHGKGERTWVLDHRILVDGYWRRQWYGSGADRWQDWVYIHPHYRGPDGAPLVVTEKIRALVR